MIIFTLIFIAILGLVFGSFFAAFSYRLPRGASIVKGRSKCPNCKAQIAWYDNIPLLSFLLLGGKCRNCKKPISWRYFWIELTTSVGFLVIFLSYSFDLLLVIYLLIVFSVLLLVFVIDLEHKIIPDSIVFFGVILSVFTFLLIDSSALPSRILAGFLGALILLIIHLVTKGRGMGLGDVKFAVFAGLFIGLKMVLVWLFIGFLTGAIVGIILILVKGAKLKDQIPFGPFLVISVVLTFIFGGMFLKLLGF